MLVWGDLWFTITTLVLRLHMNVHTFLAAPSVVTTGVSIKVFDFRRGGVGVEVIGTLQLGDLAGLEATAGGLGAGWAGCIGTGFDPSLVCDFRFAFAGISSVRDFLL